MICHAYLLKHANPTRTVYYSVSRDTVLSTGLGGFWLYVVILLWTNNSPMKTRGYGP